MIFLQYVFLFAHDTKSWLFYEILALHSLQSNDSKRAAFCDLAKFFNWPPGAAPGPIHFVKLSCQGRGRRYCWVYQANFTKPGCLLPVKAPNTVALAAKVATFICHCDRSHFHKACWDDQTFHHLYIQYLHGSSHISNISYVWHALHLCVLLRPCGSYTCTYKSHMTTLTFHYLQAFLSFLFPHYCLMFSLIWSSLRGVQSQVQY